MAWTRPDSMALTRADWSDIRRQIIFLALAGCAPLYLSYASKTILSSRVASTNLYGPEPTGLASKAFGSGSTIFFGTIRATAIRDGKSAKGYFSLNSTVPASTAFTVSMKGTNCAISEAFFGSRMRSKLNTTSSAVTADPSWKVAPLRRVAR